MGCGPLYYTYILTQRHKFGLLIKYQHNDKISKTIEYCLYSGVAQR